MARNVRNENIALIARLKVSPWKKSQLNKSKNKAERRKIDEDLELFGQEGGLLEHMNSNLIDQKELTDELVAKLVTGLNQRMSLKAQTQERAWILKRSSITKNFFGKLTFTLRRPNWDTLTSLGHFTIWLFSMFGQPQLSWAQGHFKGEILSRNSQADFLNSI